jgi:hypothetical protein
VFFVARADGCLDVWDYLAKQGEAALAVQVTGAPLTALRVQVAWMSRQKDRQMDGWRGRV